MFKINQKWQDNGESIKGVNHYYFLLRIGKILVYPFVHRILTQSVKRRTIDEWEYQVCQVLKSIIGNSAVRRVSNEGCEN